MFQLIAVTESRQFTAYEMKSP